MIKKINNKNGVALVWTLIFFMVFMILIPSIIYIAAQDILETDWQSDRTDAYYVALAGVEIGYAALISDIGGSNIYLDLWTDTKSDVMYSYSVMNGTDVIGVANVSISNNTIDGKRWIQVESIGTVTGSIYTNRSVLRVDPLNYNRVVRENYSN